MPQQITREQMLMEQIDKQIQGMRMSDEQIEESGRALVQQQYEFEQEREWRKNLLEQTGMQFSPGFVERTARVAGHEPLLKRSDDKDQQEMYDKVTKKAAKQKKRIDKENKKLQKDQAQHWASASIRANSLSSEAQYNMLEAARGALYQARRKNLKDSAVFERMYRDLYAACEVNASYANQIRAYGLAMGDEEILKDEALRAEVDRRLGVLYEQQRLAEGRVQDIFGAMRLLERMSSEKNFDPGSVTDREKEVLKQYKSLPAAGWDDSRIDAIERQAGFAKELQAQKREKMRTLVKERLQAGMGEGEVAEDKFVDAILNVNRQYLFASQQDEEFNRRLADQIVHKYEEREGIKDALVLQDAMTDYYDRLRALDLDRYSAMSDAELMRHVDELAEFEITFQTAQKFGLVSAPGQRVQMREDYCKKNGIHSDVLQTREMLSMYLSKKARLLWYLQAYKFGVLNGDLIDPMDAWTGLDPETPPFRMLDPIQKSFLMCRMGLESWTKVFEAQRAAFG